MSAEIAPTDFSGRSRQKPRFLPAEIERCPLKSPQAISAK
jgi:hypothetical protein